jgi:prevent-host-death family protein
MTSTYSVTQTQRNLPRLLKDTAEEGTIAITCREETVAYLVSREKMDSLVETMEILNNPEARKAIRAYEQGHMKFHSLSSLDEKGR